MRNNVHAFNVDLAIKFSIEEALLLQHFYYWYQNNKGKEFYCRDGHVWTYNTLQSICEIFPYFNKTKVFRTIELLETKGLIVVGNYNKISFDKTKWYALTTKGLSLFTGAPVFQSETPAVQSETPAVQSETPAVQSEPTIPNLASNLTSLNNKKNRHLDTLRARAKKVAQESSSALENSFQELTLESVTLEEKTQHVQAREHYTLDINLEEVTQAESFFQEKKEVKSIQPQKQDNSTPKVDLTQDNDACVKRLDGVTYYIAKARVKHKKNGKLDHETQEIELEIPVNELPNLNNKNLVKMVCNWKDNNREIYFQERGYLIDALSFLFQVEDKQLFSSYY